MLCIVTVHCLHDIPLFNGSSAVSSRIPRGSRNLRRYTWESTLKLFIPVNLKTWLKRTSTIHASKASPLVHRLGGNNEQLSAHRYRLVELSFDIHEKVKGKLRKLFFQIIEQHPFYPISKTNTLIDVQIYALFDL